MCIAHQKCPRFYISDYISNPVSNHKIYCQKLVIKEINMLQINNTFTNIIIDIFDYIWYHN